MDQMVFRKQQNVFLLLLPQVDYGLVDRAELNPLLALTYLLEGVVQE